MMHLVCIEHRGRLGGLIPDKTFLGRGSALDPSLGRLGRSEHVPVREDLLDLTLEAIGLEGVDSPQALLSRFGNGRLNTDGHELECWRFAHAAEHLADGILLFQEEMSSLWGSHLDRANADTRNVASAHQVSAAQLGDGVLGRGRGDGARGGSFPDALNADGLGEVGAESALEITLGGESNALESGNLFGPVELEVGLVVAERVRRHVGDC